MAFNLFNGIFLAAFLMSALVQYNDPDTLLWVLIYTAAAWMCVAQYRKNLPRWLPPSLLVVSLAWMAWLLPALTNGVSWHDIFESLSMKTKAVEEAREFGGLALVAGWAAVLTFHRNRAAG